MVDGKSDWVCEATRTGLIEDGLAFTDEAIRAVLPLAKRDTHK